jgi:tRNA threonylcarbamoyladenosine biosynthesis protein TsaB
MPPPRILALETSGRLGSVAVALGPTLLAVRQLSPDQRHAVELMPAIRDLTQAQGWAAADIDHIYLSLGPGSFTGLRIAVAVARAMAQATAGGCKLIGVPSLDVIAHNAPPEFQIVIPMLDAKRNHVFAARYERQPNGELLPTAPAALVDPNNFLTQTLTLTEKRAASPISDFRLQTSDFKIALLGEALTHFQPTHPHVTSLPPDLWPARAQTVHQLGYALAQANHFSDPATLLPLYIRLPEAEEVYRKKHGLPA